MVGLLFLKGYIMSVGLDTNFSNFGYAQSFGNGFGLNNQFAGVSSNKNSALGGSLFSNNPLQPVNNNYEDDFMMPNFLKTSNQNQYSSGEVTPPPAAESVKDSAQGQPTSSFTGEKNAAGLDDNAAVKNGMNDELKNYSLNNLDKNVVVTDKGNIYRKTDASKNTLAFLGFLAPAAGKIVQWAKGGKFSELFKFKQLAIACPIVALAGYGVGTLIDSYVNNQRAKAADAEVMLKSNNYAGNMQQVA